jgi:protein-disulfide isomerase
MRFKFLSLALLITTFILAGNAAFADQISDKEATRLEKFFKGRFGTNMSPNTAVDVEGLEASPIKGLETGKFIITTPQGSQDVPFLISKDGKYVLMGNVVDTKKFEETPIKGIKKGAVPIARGDFPILMTTDGKFLIINSDIVDISKFKPSEELKGLKEGSFTMGGQQVVPVFISDSGQYLILGTKAMDTTVDPHKEVMEQISLEGIPVKGADDAEVVIVEYSDFQCPFCKKGKDLVPGILKEYDGKVKVYYKQLPLQNHNWAMPAAIASLCVYEQGGNEKFWAFHDKLFDNQKSINLKNSKEMFNKYAKDVGVDTKKFDSCLDSPKVKATVEKQMKEASAIGVQSTPTFVVNGMIVPGANPDGLKSAIDIQLSEEGS